MRFKIKDDTIELPDEELTLFLHDLQFAELQYEAGIKEVETKIEILKKDFQLRYNYNPIEHITSRVKAQESLLSKMIKNGISLNINDVKERVQDIAGVRVVCSFVSDIYKIVNMIKNNTDFIVVKEKDYIQNPKESGYKSYHIIVKVPVYLTSGMDNVMVEIQIRTMAMDFWATLEHKIKYKYSGYIPEDIKQDLLDCSKIAGELDTKMLLLKRTIEEGNF